MWADDVTMAKAIAAEMMKLIRPRERNDAPAPEPAPVLFQIQVRDRQHGMVPLIWLCL